MWTCEECGKKQDETSDVCQKCGSQSDETHDSRRRSGANSFWWLGALLPPIAFAALGIMLAPRFAAENDWLGLGAIFKAAMVFTAGCVLSVICTIVSRCRRENLFAVAGVGAWPSILWLAILLGIVAFRFIAKWY
jgi:hypothetical protein